MVARNGASQKKAGCEQELCSDHSSWVRSRSFVNFRRNRDAKIAPLSKAHMANGLTVSPYTVTVWDEFQRILSAPYLFPG
jgi:hypothetical protein